MKRLLGILGSLGLGASVVAPVTAASRPIQVYSTMPKDFQFVMDNGQNSATISFKTNLTLWNNKPFPSPSKPDLKIHGVKKPSEIIPSQYNKHEEGFGVRLSANLQDRDNFYGDKYLYKADIPIHEWHQASFVYNHDNTLVWYSKAIEKLNLREQNITLVNQSDNDLLNKPLSDEDAKKVTVEANVSFVIDLPDKPFMLNVSVGGWVIDNLLTDVHEEDEGQIFRVWLPSKPVTPATDAANGKVTGRIERNA